MITGNPNQIAVGNEYKKSFSRMIDEQPTIELDEEILKFLKGGLRFYDNNRNS